MRPFHLAFPVTDLGTTKAFYVDAYTEFEDFLTLDTLHGQYVDVEGVLINGKKVAREIEREDD